MFRHVAALGASLLFSIAVTRAGAQEAPSADANLQSELQNPVASVVSVPFQDNIGFGVGPQNRTQNTLLVQPVAPLPLLPDWNLIVRPITRQPELERWWTTIGPRKASKATGDNPRNLGGGQDERGADFRRCP